MAASTGWQKIKCVVDLGVCVGGETAKCAQQVRKWKSSFHNVFKKNGKGKIYLCRESMNGLNAASQYDRELQLND